MKILFVCTGNTCRSSMAEAMFNNMCNIDSVIAISAGMAIVKDSKTSINTANVIKDNFNVDISERKAIQLTIDMIEEVDMVLTMTSYIKSRIIEAVPNCKNKVYSFNEYVGVEGDIVDPYGGDMAIYLETYEMLKNNILLLLDKIKEDISI